MGAVLFTPMTLGITVVYPGKPSLVEATLRTGTVTTCAMLACTDSVDELQMPGACGSTRLAAVAHLLAHFCGSPLRKSAGRAVIAVCAADPGIVRRWTNSSALC